MVCALAMLPIFCPRVDLGWLYLMGVLGVAVLLIYEHRLVRPDDLETSQRCFFQRERVGEHGTFVGSGRRVDLVSVKRYCRCLSS